MGHATRILISGLLLATQIDAGAKRPGFRAADISLLDDLSHRAFLYFDEQTDPETGLTFDRTSVNGRTTYPRVASIAATGFALTSYCVAQEHHWIDHREAERRVRRTLTFFLREAPNKRGWFYHFMSAHTGERIPESEISSIDTAILLAGALTTRACFHDDTQIVSLATELFNNVDFPWMMNSSHKYFTLGWTPEHGFLHAEWASYSELLILYALGIGSPTHPISGTTWDQWRKPIESEGGYTFIGGGPLFIHQYSLAWLDLRDRFAPDPSCYFHANYLLNARLATRAQREAFGTQLASRFHGYSENVWGLTSSDSPHGYLDWGGSPDDPRIDGTVAPAAVAGSLMLTPDICLPALRSMLNLYGTKIYGRYGFVDAFNPNTGWISSEISGMAAGITLLSAENLRTGSVWRWFMSNPEPERALDIVGLVDVYHPYEHYEISPKMANEWNEP